MSSSNVRINDNFFPHNLKKIEKELKLPKSSHQLINYYLHKLNSLVEKYDSILDQIDVIKITNKAEKSYKKKYFECVEEGSKLKNSMSTLQIYLQKERDQVLSLSMENDLLRIQLLNYHKKVDKLLNIIEFQNGRKSNHDNLVGKQSKKKKLVNVSIPDTTITSLSTSRYTKSDSSSNYLKSNELYLKEDDDEEIDKLSLDTIFVYIEKQKVSLINQMMILKEDQELKYLEWKNENSCLLKEIGILTDRLHNSEEKLIEATHQAAKLGKELVSKEIYWIKKQNTFSDNLQNICKDLQNVSSHAPPQAQTLTIMEQLSQRDNLVNWYHNQCKDMENKLKQNEDLKLQIEANYKDKIKKLTEHIRYLQKKWKQENERRLFDITGFFNSAKMLSDRIKCIEKRVSKKIRFEQKAAD
uniref:Uncharacterized protein n=1 Tax=Clastoptera arizonana TaxID=38151 RepID=A0A1B6DTD7_9HEMI